MTVLGFIGGVIAAFLVGYCIQAVWRLPENQTKTERSISGVVEIVVIGIAIFGGYRIVVDSIGTCSSIVSWFIGG